MSDPFASQLNAFKKSLKDASSSLVSQRRTIASNENNKSKSPVKKNIKRSLNGSSSSASDRESKKSKLEDSETSLKIDTASNSNSNSLPSGSYPPDIPEMSDISDMPSSTLTMRLMTSSDFIKSSDRPVTINELEIFMGFKVDSQLIKCLSNVDRIKYDPVNKTLEYLSLHNIKNGDDLIKVLKNQPTFQGLSVKQLKDGWNNCLQTISKLEKEHKIIVHKTKKDNAARHIWLDVENLPVNDSVDSEFYEMWNKVKVPTHDELVRLLLDNGLKPTNVDPESLKNKATAPVQERKQKKPRRGKVTNVHMKGILKDYSSRS